MSTNSTTWADCFSYSFGCCAGVSLGGSAAAGGVSLTGGAVVVSTAGALSSRLAGAVLCVGTREGLLQVLPVIPQDTREAGEEHFRSGEIRRAQPLQETVRARRVERIRPTPSVGIDGPQSDAGQRMHRGAVGEGPEAIGEPRQLAVPFRVQALAVQRVRILQYEDSGYILPNADYTIVDEAGRIVSTGRSDSRARVRLPDAFQESWLILLGKPRRVVGRVLGAANGQPLVKQAVTVHTWTLQRSEHKTDAEGRISLKDVPEGPVSVRHKDTEAILFISDDVPDAEFLLKGPPAASTPEEERDVHDAYPPGAEPPATVEQAGAGSGAPEEAAAPG